MGRFEQKISEDDVTAARRKIDAGASLRSAAAEIPCAPSTLSVRIKKAEAAEADAGGRAIGENEQHAAQPEHPGAISAGQGAPSGDVGPVETLRGALLATKASGQPDWPTRVSAARALAALRPEELEPKSEERQPKEPSIVVYDLAPGAAPVLHRARAGAEAPASNADAPSPQHPTSSSYHMFSYEPPDGDAVHIGMWSPPDRGQSALGAVYVVHTTDESEVAERWRAELSAGKLPESGEDVPQGREAPG